MKRILSGMRPTGYLHLGNLHGALKNWITLQNQGEFECFYFVADWHALTSDFADPSMIGTYTEAIFIDWLSAGLDPEKSTLFVQSAVKEHAELFVLFSMITPVAWLERNPTYKEMKEEISNRDLSNLGFLAYPVLQAADILMYKAYGVPVGIDQLPHVELTREIARRFNYLYGEVFPEPQSLLADTPKLLGIDGRKMSKSYENAIYLSDEGVELHRKVMSMFTDPQRKRRTDPGRPEICNVFSFHNIYTEKQKVEELEIDCRNAHIGCTDCKELLSKNIAAGLEDFHAKRRYYLQHIDEVRDIIKEGNRRARFVAEKTMAEVREVMMGKSIY
ncbi:MAG: tryptophan--tRNA ligase [Syntrophales bacterium]|nr:tryptophan--tRNA ligase [Syntrophales bacterium]